MALTSLMVAGLATLAVAATYGYVGRQLVRKGGLSPEGRPILLLGGWWLATALNQTMGASLYMAAAFGWTDLALQVTYVYLQRLLLALSLVGLMYYLIYLHSGRRMLVLLGIVYGGWWLSQVYVVVTGQPDGVMVARWRTDLAYAQPRPPWADAMALFVVVPPVVGALALLRLYRRVGTTTQRFRILVLAFGFTLWWIVAVIAGRREALDSDAIQAINRAVGVLVALAVLVAYEPFGWMQRRFHIEPAPSRD